MQLQKANVICTAIDGLDVTLAPGDNGEGDFVIEETTITVGNQQALVAYTVGQPKQIKVLAL